ncbi:DUF5776 domain-containing protein [Lentilactobacillus otakiensis]|uniref:DUF5776 domain-containing protein n=1 Tax=Lentilactobacillus otakiensis TaxID=481720 RepID=UPI003D186016
MSDKTVRFSLTRTVRLLVTFAVTIVFWGLLSHQSIVKAADGDVTYQMHSIDIYGNPIDSEVNGQKMVVSADTNFLDVTKLVPTTLDNNRYVAVGYYHDNQSGQEMMYYRDFADRNKTAAEFFTRLEVYNPARKAGDTEVEIYFAYKDTQSAKPDRITLTPGALEREAGKIKTFYTDVHGNELKPSVSYEFEDVPDVDSTFEREFNGYRYVAAVIRNPRPYGTYVYSESGIYANMATNVEDLLFQAILQPRYMNGVAMRLKQHEAGSTATFIYEKVAHTLTVEYLDETGKPIPGYPTKIQELKTGSDFSAEAPEISGYTLIGDKKVTGKLTEDQKITFKYQKKVTPPATNNNGGGTITRPTEESHTNSVQPDGTVEFPAPKELPDGTQLPNYAATQGTVVYATKAIYMYKDPNFKKSQRIVKYPKAKRVHRPMFVVTSYARSASGALRYRVKDVNHQSKTAGKVGYITANLKFVVKVYYTSMPKDKRITVISKNGVNAYRNANLTKKVKQYKSGSHLKVKKIVKHNLTTRYQLSNGYYITGNKKLVIHGNY